MLISNREMLTTENLKLAAYLLGLQLEVTPQQLEHVPGFVTDNPKFDQLESTTRAILSELRRRESGPYTLAEAIASRCAWREVGNLTWYRFKWDDGSGYCCMESSMDGVDWDIVSSGALWLEAPDDLTVPKYELSPWTKHIRGKK